MSNVNKYSITDEILTPLVGFCVILSLFLWQFQSHQTLWLRRTFLYIGGLIAVGTLIKLRGQIKYSRRTVILLALLIIFNSISLLIGKPHIWGLIGQPIAHPSLLSFYSSIAISLLFAVSVYKRVIYKLFYLILTIFILLNILYWPSHGISSRLGLLGVQLNYTAYLIVIGLITGAWIYNAKKLLPNLIVYIAQTILFFGALLTQSRVAILLALIIGVYFAYLTFKDSKTIFITVLTLLLLLFGITTSSNRFNRVHNQHYLGESISYRLDLVKAAIPTDKKQLIFGAGVGGIERNIGKNGQHYAPINKDLGSGWRYESSHNYLIDILVERGVIVLALFICLAVFAIKLGLSSRKSELKLLVYLLIFTLFFWLFNNINIQAEVILWCCILGLLVRINYKGYPQDG